MKFWEVDGNVVFPEVNCLVEHAEGGRWFQGRNGLFLYARTSDNARYCGVGGIYCGVSVVVGGVFERGW